MQYFALLWPKGKHNTYRNASNSSKSRQASFTLKHKHSTGTCHLSSAIIHDIPTEQRIKYKTSCLCYQIIMALPFSTWLTLSKSVPLLGLCVLPMMQLFASPPSKENKRVARPSVSLLYKPGILSLSLSIIALLSLPSSCLKTHLFTQYLISFSSYFLFLSPPPPK